MLGFKQRKIYDAIENALYGQDPHQILLMVLGSAGTGKSFLIHSIRSLVSLKSGPHAVKVTAPTGIALFNISGRSFRIWKHQMKRCLSCRSLEDFQMKFKNMRLLIVDELSFISGEVLDCLDRRLNQIFPANGHLPFGGIMLLGDLFQLPPVGGSPPYTINSHSSAAGARGLALWRSFSEVYVLDFIYRQQGDEEFRMALQRLARGGSTEADWRLFMTKRVQNISAEENAVFDKNLHLSVTIWPSQSLIVRE